MAVWSCALHCTFRCWGLAGCGTWPTAWRRGTGGFRGWSGRTAGVSRCPRPILPRWQWSYWRRRRYSSSGGEWPGHKLLVTVLLPCHCSIQLVRSVHYDLSIMSWIASPKGNLYKVRQPLVDRVLLTSFLPLWWPWLNRFWPRQASTFSVMEFSPLSHQNPVRELLPYLVMCFLFA